MDDKSEKAELRKSAGEKLACSLHHLRALTFSGALLLQPAGTTITQLNAKRGKLFTYRILNAEFLNMRARSIVIDCGFNTARILPMAQGPRPPGVH